MECVIYVRVSTDTQVKGTSLDTQQKACIDFAKTNGWKVPKENIFRDEGESAKATNRKELLNMLDTCRKKKDKIGVCLVWKIDRFSRNTDDHVMLRTVLKKYGVVLRSVTEPIGNDAVGLLTENMLSAFAQFDNDIRTYRTTSGMKKRLEQGGWPHDAPIGYIKSRTANGVTSIAPDPDMAPKLKILLETFSTGEYTVRQASDLAYELGITGKNGKKRTWQTTENTLKNPIYAGYIQSKYTEGKRYMGLHKALISSDTYEKNQRVLAGKHRVFVKTDETNYPLRRDFLKCAYCDKFVTASAPRGNGGRYPRYSCTNCRASVIKKPVSKGADEIHREFKELLSCIRYKPGRMKLFKSIVLSRWCDEYDDALKTASEVNKELDQLKTERLSTLRKFNRDQISFEDKEATIKEIDKEIADWQDKKTEADIYANEKEKIVDNAILFMEDPSKLWNQAPVQIQKRVQRVIFPEGLRYDFETGFGTVKINNSYQLIKKIADESAKNPIVVAATGIEPVTLGL